MTRYEELLEEYSDLDVEEKEKMKHEGLYADGCIWISKDVSENRKACILAEEIGHHELTVGDITDQTDIANQKQELKARKWAYRKIIPLRDIFRAMAAGYGTPWEMAEYLDVDEMFLRECLKIYGFMN